MTVLIQTSLLVKLDELQVCQLAQNFFVWKSLIDEPFEMMGLLSFVVLNFIQPHYLQSDVPFHTR